MKQCQKMIKIQSQAVQKKKKKKTLLHRAILTDIKFVHSTDKEYELVCDVQ